MTFDLHFKVTTFFDFRLRNDTRLSHSYYRTSIGSRMRSIDGWYFQWPWVTPTRFSRSWHFWSWISQKRCILGTNLLKNTNRKPYTIYRMIPLSITLSDLWPHFKVMTFFEVECRQWLKRGGPGGSAPCSHLSPPPAIAWAPLIESIKCYFTLK